jgi:hypothetical protein
MQLSFPIAQSAIGPHRSGTALVILGSREAEVSSLRRNLRCTPDPVPLAG